MNSNSTMGRCQHIDAYDCFFKANFDPKKASFDDYTRLIQIKEKIKNCAACKANYNEFTVLNNAMNESIREAKAMRRKKPSWVQQKINDAILAGKEIVTDFAWQPRFALAGATKGENGPMVAPLMKSLSAKGEENAEIEITEVSQGFYRFVLEKETDVRIADDSTFDLSSWAKEDIVKLKLVFEGFGETDYPETEADIVRIGASVIEFDEVKLPAGEYVFYLRG